MESQDGKFYWSESGGASSAMWREITQGEYRDVRARYPRIDDAQEASDQASPDEPLLPIILGQSGFYSESLRGEFTFPEYCASEGARMGFEVATTRYCILDMDGDGEKEAVVDFRFGDNWMVMCMVLKQHDSLVSGTEFYYRQLNDIHQDGSFRFSGGGDHDGWGVLRFNPADFSWSTVPVEERSNVPEVLWYYF